MVQENHTTDNYFRNLAGYGATVAADWPIQANPPASDQPHDRHAYYRWLTGEHKATRAQFDTTTSIPFYAYLALTGAFLENHCSGFGTNSTPNHLLIVGGQSPTLRNPSRTQPPPLWDMPSVPGLAADAAGIPKTVMQLLGLPRLGVDRVDNDPGLADLIDPALHNPAPPAYGSKVTLPAPPQPAPNPTRCRHLPQPCLSRWRRWCCAGAGHCRPPNDVPLTQRSTER